MHTRKFGEITLGYQMIVQDSLIVQGGMAGHGWGWGMAGGGAWIGLGHGGGTGMGRGRGMADGGG